MRAITWQGEPERGQRLIYRMSNITVVFLWISLNWLFNGSFEARHSRGTRLKRKQAQKKNIFILFTTFKGRVMFLWKWINFSKTALDWAQNMQWITSWAIQAHASFYFWFSSIIPFTLQKWVLFGSVCRVSQSLKKKL